MKKFLPLLVGALFLLGAVEVPQAWPQDNGDVCYTYFGALSCVAQGDKPSVTAIPLPSATPTRFISPTPTRPPSTATPILAWGLENPGFESGLQAWTPYNANGPLSELLVEERSLSAGLDPLDVFSGDKSIMVSRMFACWRGGLYQTVRSVPTGVHVRVTARIMTYGSDNSGIHSPNVNMNSRLGIGFDGLGLANPNASRVDWFVVVGGDTVPTIGGRDPVWQLAQHDFVTGSSGALTIFLMADLGRVAEGQCNWPMNFTRARFDAVTLEVVP